ncbi:hypothetical protein [Tenacibaculum sp. SG-28]|uniref:hypothetical protein n=1 Tax=Tenacibaculum sp. SG-28 TaxID=754426 RepID=UPI000CF41234|nr:hypothetical protein [Tenacibaculum sp. SG-28]PQJ21000.1 hypothetical protein BSU00_08155 [Tenacibaculum sp. SG-28]
MNPRRLSLFKEKKGFYISPENIVAIVWLGIIFLLYYLKNSFGYDFEGIESVILIIGTLYIIGLLISTFLDTKGK